MVRILHRQSETQSAIRQLRRIIENPVKKFREDIQGTARILMVLLQYEMDDIDAMEYYIRIASQFLYRRKAIFPFERALLNFFRFCVRHTDSGKRLDALENLKDRANDLLKSDSSIRAFHFFDYLDWIDATIISLKASDA